MLLDGINFEPKRLITKFQTPLITTKTVDRSVRTPGGHANFNICIKINDLLHLHNERLKCFVPTVGRRPKIVQIFVRIAEKVSKTF